MLLELVVSDLGVIDHVSINLSNGLIALTGETGAGKTLMVDAINLLVGGRADPGLVKPGAKQASVDGRFLVDGEEYILSRIVPAEGRSRAYIDGRPVTAGALAELGSDLIDLHGQHEHQSLLQVSAQRRSLDLFGQIDLGPLEAARVELSRIDSELERFGGDPRDRAREMDLLQYQIDELSAANLGRPNELEALAEQEDMLANSSDYKKSANRALEFLADDSEDTSGRDLIGKALQQIEGIEAYAHPAVRIRDLLAELDDLVDELRSAGDQISDDPDLLSSVRSRRQQLLDLCRKYGADLDTVMTELTDLSARFDELTTFDERAAALDIDKTAALASYAIAAEGVKAKRTAAAPKLAKAIEVQLPDLAMPKARIGVMVSGEAGAEVEFQLAANPGAELQALSKVASGGELARTMLALRGVLSEAPPILVFDEVDAGIGGEAGLSVGRALARLGETHQVLVVTHLAQVAACAQTHLVVEKRQGPTNTISVIEEVSGADRTQELARMLSGQPDSTKAQEHADELLLEASAQ